MRVQIDRTESLPVIRKRHSNLYGKGNNYNLVTIEKSVTNSNKKPELSKFAKKNKVSPSNQVC